jgi:hypothetical protein
VQYIPQKKARFGKKTNMLCVSKSGYVFSIIIYIGKGTKFDEQYKDLPVFSQVEKTLLKPLLDKGYCLKVDNFYTSPQLADILISHTTDVYGTVKMTRKDMPPSGKSKKLKKGEAVAFQRWKPCIGETRKMYY